MLNNINTVLGHDYGAWTACSVTCGDGTRTRTRTEATSAANGGAECTGRSTETESCNTGSCLGKILFYHHLHLKYWCISAILII